MENYYGFYKCRRCGEKFLKCELEGEENVFHSMWKLVNNENPILPKLFAMHFCNKSNDDSIGLADFIGFEKEINNAKTND